MRKSTTFTDQQEQRVKVAITKGVESGLSEYNIPDIMEEVEKKMKADGRL